MMAVALSQPRKERDGAAARGVGPGETLGRSGLCCGKAKGRRAKRVERVGVGPHAQ